MGPSHRQAINGWFIANYWLYVRSDPISPYGFDQDLLARLKEAIGKVDNEGFRESSFVPVKLAEVRGAVDLVEAEEVRLAGGVPALVSEGRLDEALAINAIALDMIQGLSTDSGESVHYGVTADGLAQNRDYIETLRSIAETPTS